MADNRAKFQKLAKMAKGLSILYAEDNLGLQKQAKGILLKFFETVTSANDGQEAYRLFENNPSDIIVTDIKMPKMSGLDLVKRAKLIESDTKIVITSAYDDKEYLYRAIDVGVDKYLKKPIALDVLVDALTEIVEQIRQERTLKLFNLYIKDVFQHQDNMLLLLDAEDSILIVNKKTLQFFGQKTLREFKAFFQNFGSLLLEHNNFLYNQNGFDWLDTVKKNSGKLFNVKIADLKQKSRHFILKSYVVPEKDGVYILSFDDITELNLLEIYDKNAVNKEKSANELKTIYNLLDIIKRNHSKVKLFNSYKGLSISNAGVIVDLNEQSISLQTSYLQQRAIAIDKCVVLESEVFPQAIWCELESLNYESQKVEFKNPKFISHSPMDQEFVRVVPKENSNITLFFEEIKLHAETTIIDISVVGVKLDITLIPPGFKVGDRVKVDVVLTDEKRPVIINVMAQVHLIREKKRTFEIVVIFEDSVNAKRMLVDYIAKRQMELIREFKGLKYQ